ncbi:MAG: phytoene desaturase family protein [Myxococcota bacterium]
MSPRHHDVVVVGAGLAGLTAAAYLSRAGHSVLLVEKTGHCGGLLNSIERNGFLFDTGARSIENAGVIRPMLKDLGIELELVKSPVSIGIEGTILDMASRDGIGAYRKLFERLYPGHEKEIARIFLAVDKVMRDMDVIYGFDNPVFRDFKNDKNYLFTELLPWMAKFVPAAFRMNRMSEPIESYLAGLSSFRPLNDLVAQHFFKQTPMFFALGYFYVYLDYLYPRGGTGRLAAKLAEKIREAGGEILLDTEVTSVVPAARRLAGSHGLDCRYETLVWCADLKSLYRRADATGLDAATVRAIAARRQQVMGSRGGDSVFSLYLGVDQPPETFAAKTHGHLFYTPSRAGLAETHRSELAALLASPQGDNREAILAWVGKYCRLTTYEVSIPSLRDPTLSPQGQTGLIVSFLFEYDLVRKVIAAGWYEAFKTQVEDAMIEALDTSLFPGIKDAIVLRFSSSPSTIETLFASSEGGITGWTFERPSPAVHALQKIPKAVETPFPGILQAGQWTYSPAGIPTAILTGWYAQDAVRRVSGLDT